MLFVWFLERKTVSRLMRNKVCGVGERKMAQQWRQAQGMCDWKDAQQGQIRVGEKEINHKKRQRERRKERGDEKQKKLRAAVVATKGQVCALTAMVVAAVHSAKRGEEGRERERERAGRAS